MVGLARWWRQADQHENALALFRQAIDRNLSDELLFRTLWDIAALEKKLGREQAALPVLTDLAASSNPWRAAALVELAKYYERRQAQLRPGPGNDPRRSRSGTLRSAPAPRRAPGKRVSAPKTSRTHMTKTFFAVSVCLLLASCAKPPKLDVSLTLDKQNAGLIFVKVKVVNTEDRATVPIAIEVVGQTQTNGHWDKAATILHPAAFVLNRKEQREITKLWRVPADAARTTLAVKEQERGNLLKTENAEKGFTPAPAIHR